MVFQGFWSVLQSQRLYATCAYSLLVRVGGRPEDTKICPIQSSLAGTGAKLGKKVINHDQ